LDEWLNRKDSWPYKNEDWFTDVLKFVQSRIVNCTKTCVICDGPLPFEMIKPSGLLFILILFVVYLFIYLFIYFYLFIFLLCVWFFALFFVI
jgi:hypothetical protein